MIVTLAYASGDTNIPRAAPRYTSNTLCSPGNMSSGPSGILTFTLSILAGNKMSVSTSIKSSPAKYHHVL